MRRMLRFAESVLLLAVFWGLLVFLVLMLLGNRVVRDPEMYAVLLEDEKYCRYLGEEYASSFQAGKNRTSGAEASAAFPEYFVLQDDLQELWLVSVRRALRALEYQSPCQADQEAWEYFQQKAAGHTDHLEQRAESSGSLLLPGLSGVIRQRFCSVMDLLLRLHGYRFVFLSAVFLLLGLYFLSRGFSRYRLFLLALPGIIIAETILLFCLVLREELILLVKNSITYFGAGTPAVLGLLRSGLGLFCRDLTGVSLLLLAICCLFALPGLFTKGTDNTRVDRSKRR